MYITLHWLKAIQICDYLFSVAYRMECLICMNRSQFNENNSVRPGRQNGRTSNRLGITEMNRVVGSISGRYIFQ